MLNCSKLAHRIEKLQPQSDHTDVARTCLLLANTTDAAKIDDDQQLLQAWQDVSLRLQAVTDQHAAVTEELAQLARSDPRKFSQDQIWVLVRAIKVQSQVLHLYMGETAINAQCSAGQ